MIFLVWLRTGSHPTEFIRNQRHIGKIQTLFLIFLKKKNIILDGLEIIIHLT